MRSLNRILTIAALLFASGCRIDANQPPAATAQGTSGVATPLAVSVTSVDVPSNGLTGETAIADNFDGTAGIAPTTYGPNGTVGFPFSAGDGAAAFRMMCTGGQLVRDDPLVYPGQPGVSHLHQFFGNTGTNASSNYQSLRTSGGTTCGQSSTPFNRSAYWFPAMLDGVGNVVKPDYIKLYYKRNAASDPMCRPLSSAYQSLGQCTDLPNGLRYVFGYNMNTGAPWFDGTVRYNCVASEDGTVSNGTATGNYNSIAETVAAGCPVGAQLVIAANSPSCWDGMSLDTADHRSHMAYATGPWYTGQLFNACTVDHPYPIPNMEVLIQFTVDANFAKWHLSSDEMVPGAPAGSTFHMDYWEAWSPVVKATWHQYCINGQLSCSSGDLGNGTQVVGAGVPYGGFPKHQLVSLTSLGITTSTPTTTSPTPTTQVCPDGSVIPLTQTCPVPVTSTTSKPRGGSGGGKAIGKKK